MKTLLTSLVLGAASLTASAQWTTSFETLDDPSVYKGKYAPVAAPSVYATNGNLITTGFYDRFVMMGDYALENIATSSYVCATDTTSHSTLWAVGLKGASQVTAVAAAPNGHVIVAGVFADDVVMGSTDYAEKTLEGSTLTHDYANAFVADYTADGVLDNVYKIIPQIADKYANAGGDIKLSGDIAVTPTSISCTADGIFVGMTYRGGYAVDGLSIYGNILKTEAGFTLPRCCSVMKIANGSVSEVLSFKGTGDENTSGRQPYSLCITADGNDIIAGMMTSGDNTLIAGGETKEVNFAQGESGDVYGAVLVRLGEGVSVKQFDCIGSSRYWTADNSIKSMKVSKGKLYLSGSICTPLPFDDSLVPDLWTDQYAACLDATTFETKWAHITGALRDDMPNANAKYRHTIGAEEFGGRYVVYGSIVFGYNPDEDAFFNNNNEDPYLSIAYDGKQSLSLTVAKGEGTLVTVEPFISGDAPEPQPVKGDVNGDGQLTIEDITELIEIYLQK